jgi:predicted transposase/invertase (TIGR01784 family)
MDYDKSLKKKWDDYSIKQTAYNDGVEVGVEKGIVIGTEKGKEEGIEIGVEKGSNQKARAIARELLKIGMPIEQIVQTTGLSEEEIAEIAEIKD